MKKRQVIFVYYNENEEFWMDGLYQALMLLSNDYDVTMHNLAVDPTPIYKPSINWGDYDFVLGWGAFGSPADGVLKNANIKKGLCIGGNAKPPDYSALNYDVLFYETEWYRPTIEHHPNIIHAFGVNTKIFKPRKSKKVFDYLTVGSYSLWKRQDRLINKPGLKIALGEIQKNNPQESFGIIAKLLGGGVIVSDLVSPKTLANFYSLSKTLYIPADVNGGGERAVLEARACDIDVEVDMDNPKLMELLTSPVWDEEYYYKQLKKGIELCLPA